jgi:hypothetical protein
MYGTVRYRTRRTCAAAAPHSREGRVRTGASNEDVPSPPSDPPPPPFLQSSKAAKQQSSKAAKQQSSKAAKQLVPLGSGGVQSTRRLLEEWTSVVEDLQCSETVVAADKSWATAVPTGAKRPCPHKIKSGSGQGLAHSTQLNWRWTIGGCLEQVRLHTHISEEGCSVLYPDVSLQQDQTMIRDSLAMPHPNSWPSDRRRFAPDRSCPTD